jgi:hypothetical protein
MAKVCTKLFKATRTFGGKMQYKFSSLWRQVFLFFKTKAVCVLLVLEAEVRYYVSRIL